jgi:hypothetical protein
LFDAGASDEMFAMGLEKVLFQPNNVELLSEELESHESFVELDGRDKLAEEGIPKPVVLNSSSFRKFVVLYPAVALRILDAFEESGTLITDEAFKLVTL